MLDRNARLFVAVSLVSGFGATAMTLAAGVWVMSLTGDAGLAGLAGLFVYLPSVVGPVLGVLVDRLPRQRLLIVTNLAMGGLLTTLLAVRSGGDIWILYAVMLGYGVTFVLLDAAESAVLPAAVPGDGLAVLNGARISAQEGTKLVAPLAGAGLFAVAGGPAVALMSAGLLLVSAVLYSRVRLSPVVATAPPGSASAGSASAPTAPASASGPAAGVSASAPAGPAEPDSRVSASAPTAPASASGPAVGVSASTSAGGTPAGLDVSASAPTGPEAALSPAAGVSASAPAGVTPAGLDVSASAPAGVTPADPDVSASAPIGPAAPGLDVSASAPTGATASDRDVSASNPTGPTPADRNVSASTKAGRAWRRLWADVADGVRELGAHPPVLALTLAAAGTIALSGVATPAMYALVDEGLGKPAAFLGVLVAIQGAGSIASGLIAGPLAKARGELFVVAAGALLTAFGTALRAVPDLSTAIAGAVLVGIGLPWTVVAVVTALQRTIPPTHLGRASASANSLMFAPTALAIPLGAAALQVVSYQVIFVATAALTAAVGVGLAASRR